ncbi:GDSL-type esterase/lipase family protein [Akkermansiaceae bacterium]|nr:GDSL-type esterase/lipase family protein [Akkermansiaceae bacterium]
MKIPLILASLFSISLLSAQTAAPAEKAPHSALKPESRGRGWMKRHESMNKNAAGNQYDILFIGDSITQGWEGAGKDTWKKYYSKKNALNLGISGDRTQHVIWRLQNGNLKNQENAKLAIIMIGTNNTGHTQQDPAETAEGVTKIVSLVKEGCPKAQVLLLGIFPRGKTPEDKLRLINVAINERIAKLDDGKTVHYLDLSDTFLDRKGILTKEVMPDALHPKEEGYKMWAKAMNRKIKELGF